MEKYYDALGLDRSCTKEDIKKAYEGFKVFDQADDEIEEAYTYLMENHVEVETTKPSTDKFQNVENVSKSEKGDLERDTLEKSHVEIVEDKSSTKSKKSKVFILASAIFIILIISLIIGGSDENGDNGEAPIESDVVALVNGIEISRDLYDTTLALYSRRYEAQYGEGAMDMEIGEGQILGDVLADEVIQILVFFVLIDQAAWELNLEISDEIIGQGADFYGQDVISRSLIEEKIITQDALDEYIWLEILSEEYQQYYFANNYVKEEAIINFYNENIDIFEQGEIRASHILVDDKALAIELIERISDGDEFTELAMEYSTCPSGSNGGDLGRFGRGQMVDAFEDAAFAQEVGGVSHNPVETNFGFHIILVTES